MSKHNVGSIGVVDELGGLVTNISLSDVKGVAYEGTLACMYMTSISYVSAMRQRSTRVRFVSRHSRSVRRPL
jgi:hypothetical protein